MCDNLFLFVTQISDKNRFDQSTNINFNLLGSLFIYIFKYHNVINESEKQALKETSLVFASVLPKSQPAGALTK